MQSQTHCEACGAGPLSDLQDFNTVKLCNDCFETEKNRNVWKMLESI